MLGIPTFRAAVLSRSTLLRGLVCHWRLDEVSGTRNDSHGTNHLTDNNTVTQAAGKIGNAAQFTALNSEYLSIADNAALSVGDIDFTFALWAMLDLKLANRVLLSKYDADAGPREYYIDFGSSSDRFRFDLYDGSGFSGEVVANSFGSPSTGTWHFLVIWHDAAANTVNIQINNGTVDSAATTGPSGDAGATFRLGSFLSTPISFWDGRIDSVSFWKRVLTAAERAALYNDGNGRNYPFA